MSNDNDLMQTAESEERAVISQLIAWAHEASDESICKLQEFIDDEKQSEEMRRMAEIARGEAEYLKYIPMNKDEEQEYNLCELINKRKDKIIALTCEVEEIEDSLKMMELKGKIHAQLMLQDMPDNQREEWDINSPSEDVVMMEGDRILKLKGEIAYLEAWIEEAKKFIVSPKYKNLPPGYFDKENDEMEDDDQDEDDL